MSVLLKKRKNTDGTVTPYLIICANGERTYKFLKEYKLPKGDGPIERETRVKHMSIVRQIAADYTMKIARGEYNIVDDSLKKASVTGWIDAYLKTYNKADSRIMAGALKNFKLFLEKSEIKDLTFKQLNEDLILDFRGYLEENFTGEGPGTYFKRFKRIIKRACKKLNIPNPAVDIAVNTGKAKAKDTLSLEEIKRLAATHTEAPEVKRAFLFACMTGLRWCDINGLLWSHIRDEEMQIYQKKTGGYVSQKLNATAIKILGEPGKPTDLVFKLPTANGANKSLRALVERAKINKNIRGFHNGRHSYGTLLAYNGTDILTIAANMGHSTLKYTQRYTTAARHLREKANDSLNFEL
jgi:integrase/recombinase XerD